MSRYSMNLRDRYDPSIPTIGGALSSAIGGGLDAYAAHQEALRQEQNTIASQGGRPVGAPPATPGQRLGRFVRRRILGQTEPPNDVTPSQAEPPVTLQMPAVQGYTGAGMPAAGGDQPSPLTPRRGFPSAPTNIRDALTATTQPFVGAPPSAPPPDAAAPVVRGGPARPAVPAANPGANAASIGDALDYEITGSNGQRYRVDPLHSARLAAAGKGIEMQTEQDVKDRASKATQEEQIQALVDAGMTPAVARAKVLNNVVKYDEQYGARRTAMSAADRMAVQDRIDRRQKDAQQFALQLERLRQQGRTSTREFQELSLKLRQQAQDDENDRALLAADESAAARAQGQVTSLTTNPIVQATPEGQAATTQAQARATEAAARADSSRSRVAAKSGGQRSGARPTITQAQYDAARAKINPATHQPYTDAEISQYYTIHPSVRRK